MNKIIVTVVGVLVLVVALVIFLPHAGVSLGVGNGTIWNGGVSHTNSQWDAIGGYAVNGVVVISSSTDISGNSVSSTSMTAGSLTLGGGTAITNYTCGTANYTIPALSPRQSTATLGAAHATTTVSVTSAVLGDMAFVSNNSSTSALIQYGINSRAEVSSSGIITVEFFNPTSVTSTAITTSTLKACYIH